MVWEPYLEQKEGKSQKYILKQYLYQLFVSNS